jgi:hypothetical protein
MFLCRWSGEAREKEALVEQTIQVKIKAKQWDDINFIFQSVKGIDKTIIKSVIEAAGVAFEWGYVAKFWKSWMVTCEDLGCEEIIPGQLATPLGKMYDARAVNEVLDVLKQMKKAQFEEVYRIWRCQPKSHHAVSKGLVRAWDERAKGSEVRRS